MKVHGTAWDFIILQEDPLIGSCTKISSNLLPDNIKFLIVSLVSAAPLGSNAQVLWSQSVDALEQLNLHARSLTPPATTVLFEVQKINSAIFEMVFTLLNE